MICSIRAIIPSIGGSTGVTIRYRSVLTAKVSSPRLCMEDFRDLGATGRAQELRLLHILELGFPFRLYEI